MPSTETNPDKIDWVANDYFGDDDETRAALAEERKRLALQQIDRMVSACKKLKRLLISLPDAVAQVELFEEEVVSLNIDLDEKIDLARTQHK